MRFVADLHIHSRFSRATSRDLDPEHLWLWAQKKGITVIGTGDFTHPGWLGELKSKLVPAEDGLYRLNSELVDLIAVKVPRACRNDPRFLLTGEISCIYKKDGRTRKLHHLILMPDFQSVERLTKKLSNIGNITSDGRPILGLDSRDLLELVLEADERAFFIPAHIWTPWFSLFGSKSGFDHIEECFGDLSPYIHAVETGLSSDPPMNRMLAALDSYTLVSNSDAHSASKLGREANLFDTALDYPSMVKAMSSGEGFVGTIEFFPEEGKYHLDGHRKCGIRMDPLETMKHGGVCPKCEKPVTVGVLYRVLQLADRSEPVLTKEFLSLIPLSEILSEILGAGPATKRVCTRYEELLNNLGPELYILMEVSLNSIEKHGGLLLKEAIKRMREGRVIKEAGFDGEYGKIKLFEQGELSALQGQSTLFEKEKKLSERTSACKSAPGSVHSLKRPSTKGSQPEQTSEDPILDPLNDDQRRAVAFGGGYLLVKAGPGTGKTMTLTHRIAYLLRQGLARAEEILGLTFTRKAAEEMISRVKSLVAEGLSSSLKITTFHGFCLDLLKAEIDHTPLPRPFTLCGESDSLRLAIRILESFPGRRPGIGRFRRALYQYKLSNVVGAQGQVFEGIRGELLSRYQEYLRHLGMVDLDDLEIETLRLLSEVPQIRAHYSKKYPWIFVDEYQDTNYAQARIVKLLVGGGRGNLFAIGDPDQAIYGFRGADVTNFRRFVEDFPGATVITLTRNYRSTQRILDGAASVMGQEEPLKSCISAGQNILVATCQTGAEEAEMVVETIERLMGGVSYFSLDSGRVESFTGDGSLGFGDFAILYRLKAQAEELKKALARRGIPYLASGDAALVEYFPVSLVWRFLQIMVWPKNNLYQNAYEQLKVENGVKLCPAHEHLLAEASDQDIEALIQTVIERHSWKDLPDDGKEALERFIRIARHFEGSLEQFLEYVALERGIDHGLLGGDRVVLMTLHGAKGLQWPVVFMVGCEQGLIPCTLFSEAVTEEERRLFYVGMTRAKYQLILSCAARRNLMGRSLKCEPSPFLEAIPRTLVSELQRSGWKPRAEGHEQLKLF